MICLNTQVRDIKVMLTVLYFSLPRLLDVVHSEKKLYLVFEYLHQDLKKYMDSCSPTGLGASLIRVGFCSQKNILLDTNKICCNYSIITVKFLNFRTPKHFAVIMPPTLKKWGGHIGFGLSVCIYVRMYVCIHVRDIVLKLHVWIPHGKIADAYFWFSLNYLPLSNYGPLTNKGMKFCKCHISKSTIARNLKLVSADRG